MLSSIKNVAMSHSNNDTKETGTGTKKLELFTSNKSDNNYEQDNDIFFELVDSTDPSNYSNKSRVTNPNVKNNSGLFTTSYDKVSTDNTIYNSQQISDIQDSSSITNSSSPFQKKAIIIGTRKSHLSEMLTNSTGMPNIFNSEHFKDNRKISQ